MKILIIGNSHSGCFRRAWKIMAPHCPDVSITTYSYWRKFYGTFDVDESRASLVMTDRHTKHRFIREHGGDGSFRPLDYDLCIIIGGDRLWPGLPETGLSAQLRKLVVWDYLNGLHQMVLLRKIRQISDIPVMIVTNPHFASRQDVSIEYLPPYENGLELANAALRPALDAVLLEQPAETLHSRRLTKQEYAVGERILNWYLRAPSPPYLHDDLCHMNDAFGVLYLSEILTSLGLTIAPFKHPPAEGRLRLADKTLPAYL